MLTLSTHHTGVEYCLFEHGLPEPLPDKRIAPHFFCAAWGSWSKAQRIESFMNEKMQKSTYECPSLETVEVFANDGVLQQNSPKTGGGEGIGGGSDL